MWEVTLRHAVHTGWLLAKNGGGTDWLNTGGGGGSWVGRGGGSIESTSVGLSVWDSVGCGADWVGRCRGLVSGGSVVDGVLSLLGGILNGSGGLARLLAYKLGSLGGVVVNEVLGGGNGSVGLLDSNLLDLNGLLVDNTGHVANLSIDGLLVLLVDEWSQEEDGSSDQRESPEWDNLDQVVGDEGGNEGLDWSASAYRLQLDVKLTAPVAKTFSAKRSLWDSMTKKLISSSKSPVMLSKVSFGTV